MIASLQHLWRTWVDLYALFLTIVVAYQNRDKVQALIAWVGDKLRRKG